jgi:hypothetical protein
MERVVPAIHGPDHAVGGPDPIPSLAMWPIKVNRDGVQVKTGDRRFLWEIPEDLDGNTLMKVAAFLADAGTGATSIQIRDVDTDIDILSTALTIDSGERSSKTAAAPAVVNPTYAPVAYGQQLAIDVDSVAAGATGLGIYFYFLASVDAVNTVTGPPGTNGTNGTDGVDGTDGADGADGLGVPAGGSTGQVLTKVSGADNDTDWEDPATGSAMPSYVHLRDEKSSGTDGGGATSGSYATRTLNTEVSDTDGVCSLSSNQFTLSAGTYIIRARAPAFWVTRHKARLRNVTDSSTILIGTSAYDNGNAACTASEIVGKFTIGASKALEIQHRVESTQGTFGYGVQSGFGDTEVYTVVELWKVA